MSKAQKILIADADHESITLLGEVLQSQGYKVGYARDGRQCLDLIGRLSPDLVIVDSHLPEIDGLEIARRLKNENGYHFLPVIISTIQHDPRTRTRAIEYGADDYLTKPISPIELSARAKSLLRIKKLHDSLEQRNSEISRINERLEEAYARLDSELRLAQKLQTSLLPQSLPQLPGVFFATKFVSSGRVAGDFYDIFRLDETHVGFYIVDAIGHGVPAALLTVFIKKGIRTKEISGNEYRIIPPEEVLTNLNNDLISEDLSESPFVTICYCIYDTTTRELEYARGGHPYPLLIRRGGESLTLEAEGALLGIVEEKFDSEKVTLEEGDKLLLFSDGVDAARWGDGATGQEAFVKACLEYHDMPIEEILTRVSKVVFGPDGEAAVEDDVTIIGMAAC
ncbi:MAG: PP2C family protein-serine/threonine phosphatase [Planctomycetota bacterium]|jgi:sigma-B regulation protein RsbU (phosphoserine phosphatase)